MTSDDKGRKSLRTSLEPAEMIFMLAMPISQAAAWYLVLSIEVLGTLQYSLADVLFRLCVFHALWAVKNRFFSNPMERGYYPFAMAAAGTCVGWDSALGLGMSLLGALGVFGAFVVGSMRVISWPASKLAHVAKKTRTWANVMKAFYASSLIFWLMVSVLLLMRLVAGR